MSVGQIVDREERPPMVKFERRAMEDKPASRVAGKIVYTDVDMVLVTPPYSKDQFEQKVPVWFEQVEKNVRAGRTRPEWLEHWKEGYERFKKGEEMPLNGTSVKNWSAISPAEVKRLIGANILTIEDLAQVNDEGLRRLGMGAQELKSKAKDYVQTTKNTGPLVMEMAALRKEAAQKDATISSLIEKVEILTQRLESMKGQPLVEVHSMMDEINLELAAEVPTINSAHATEPNVLSVDYSKMKMHEIRAECKKRGIKTSPSDKKVDLIEKLA